jgi:protease I
MASDLKGRKIAILATDGFEQSELMEPRKALDKAGAKTVVIAPKAGKIKGWNHTDWGEPVNVDMELSNADVHDFDALVLPGGVMNPDHLRMDAKAVDFVGQFVKSGKPVAAICHGPWTLMETGALRGKTVTSWPSLKSDLSNAGANWVDQEVARDGQFITSRKPDDIPAFTRAIIELVGGSAHHTRAA